MVFMEGLNADSSIQFEQDSLCLSIVRDKWPAFDPDGAIDKKLDSTRHLQLFGGQCTQPTETMYLTDARHLVTARYRDPLFYLMVGCLKHNWLRHAETHLIFEFLDIAFNDMPCSLTHYISADISSD